MQPQLDLIDLDQPGLTGHRRFISCWLSRSEGLTFLVDPGPTNTVAHLIDRLDQLDVDHLDFVLLTHIHLDHGGATAHLLEAYPEARIVCHPRGQAHLAEPQRLWQGSLDVLGAVAEIYGEPLPVDESTFVSYEELAAAGIRVVETPGHAQHHISFLHADTLFAGEAAGTFLTLGKGEWYLRPATPPRFELETALASLDRLLALEPAPHRVAFAHHGLLAGHTTDLLRAARRQLALWVDVVSRVRQNSSEASIDDLAERIVPALREADPRFASGRDLPQDISVREQDFTRQTLRGMVQYVDEQAGS